MTHSLKDVNLTTFFTNLRGSNRLVKKKPMRVEPNVMKPVGILGGGQLARMMALKAHEMGVRVAVLSENEKDPAAQVTALWKKGPLNDRWTLLDFLRSCSVVTFESEFMDAELLAELERESGTPIFPKPADMAKLQDRLTQKELLEKFALPTAPYFPVVSEAEARHALKALGGKAVFKKRRFGYDGYGTFVVKTQSDFEKFVPELEKNPHGFIAEAFVKFRRELAVIVARGRDDRFIRLPFVESHQENSRCLWVKGPLKETKALGQLGKRLERFLKGIDYVGVMGIELFDSARGLFVNELAPRVHNTGHYSLDALTDDQFSLHLKAILGCELKQPALNAKGFAMMNLLGTHSGLPSWTLPGDIKLHWYGKSENRPGRKMGHINAVGATPEAALALVKRRRGAFNV